MRLMNLERFLRHHAPLGPVDGCPEIRAYQARDVMALWRAWEAEHGGRACEPPFWASIWPAARILARYLLDGPEAVCGARVLEIGCGGGVAGIAAALAGAATVVANDLDSDALEVCALNAAANGVSLELRAGDATGRHVALDADLILVADLFYERHTSEALLERLQGSAGRVLIADGGRAFAPRRGLRELGGEITAVDPDLEGEASRQVRILELVGDN